MSFWDKKVTESGKAYVEEVKPERYYISRFAPDRLTPDAVAAIRAHLDGSTSAVFRDFADYGDGKVSNDDLRRLLGWFDDRVAAAGAAIESATSFTERIVAAGAPAPRNGLLYAQGTYSPASGGHVGPWPPYGRAADRRLLLAQIDRRFLALYPELVVHRTSQRTIEPVGLSVDEIVAAAQDLWESEWPAVGDDVRALIEGPDFAKEAA